MNTEYKPFSERSGYKQTKPIQRESMDDDLRTGLWNVFYTCFPSSISAYEPTAIPHPICHNIWVDFEKNPADEEQWIEDRFVKTIILEKDWIVVFDLVEFVIDALVSYDRKYQDNLNAFIKGCNFVLERENSAYRIVQRLVTEITSEEEIQSINQAMTVSFSGVKMHIHQAYSLFSNRDDPDYRNSIKESISAVESLAKEVTRDDKATLGKLTNKLKLNSAFAASLASLYGFTSNEYGIRHGVTGEPLHVDQNTARFVLITCSAFVNYIISLHS